MDYSKPGFWISLGVGGCLIAAASFAQQMMTKEKDEDFRMRAVFRDFCIGAFLTAVIYMFLPDSIESWISAAKGAITKPEQSGGDIELNVGPARF